MPSYNGGVYSCSWGPVHVHRAGAETNEIRWVGDRVGLFRALGDWDHFEPVLSASTSPDDLARLCRESHHITITENC